MYSDDDVKGKNTEIMVAVFESGKVNRAHIIVTKHLASAYIAKGAADTVCDLVDIPGAADLDEVFDAFCGNCKIKSIATDFVRISTPPKENEADPAPTAVTVGLAATDDGPSDPTSITLLTMNKSGYTASLPRLRKNASRRFKKSVELAVAMYRELRTGGVFVTDVLVEKLCNWPSESDTIIVGDLEIKRTTFEIRVDFEIKPLVVSSS